MSADNHEARPPKRSRTEDTPRQSSAATPLDLDNFQCHEEFWFDDGSIVLIAQQKTGFRVYRALLTAQSTIFADMFTSSSPSAEEMIEGCPVVHLSDTPEDIAHLLRVLLPKSQRLLYSRKSILSFHQLSAIIRLSHKYHVQDVLDQAVEYLQTHFTSTFDAWTSNTALRVPLFSARHAIGVVNLARLIDRPALLPIAFYRCAQLGGDVVSGYRREDKTVEYLRRRDLRRCIDGRNELAEQAASVLAEVFGNAYPCDACVRRERCAIALLNLSARMVADEFVSEVDVLTSWAGRIEEWAEDLDLCEPCRRAVITQDRRARRQVWDDLPTIFGLTVEGWAASEDEDETTDPDTP
ncbi:hypothetical protein GSI_12223 [Ganoderma sinense ZZ0214-1]|uniref:BTB domain-containing protein n=1 Tax=Ganoderma sinense ZZ0214-1 TaxID=1077348 RepID=A0A2G8RY76_9APHY|nr:hypothetical protein GSI_12223 [Ganoderma sinense ZZ0214-1]